MSVWRTLVRALARHEIEQAFDNGRAHHRSCMENAAWWFSADTATMEMIRDLAREQDTWGVRARWEKATGRQAGPRPNKRRPRPMKCNQTDCDNPPAFRFTWPGRDEARICAIHALKLSGVASAMGLHVQLIQLTPEDYITAAGDQSIMSHEEQPQ